MPILKIFRANNNKIIRNAHNSKLNKVNKILAKSKNIKKIV